VGLVVECGQHFRQSAADVATAAALDFLAHFGLVEPAEGRAAPAPQHRYELLETCMVRTPDFRFERPLLGFEVFAQGELIATDGPHEIRALCDGCTVFMPTREPIVGREAVYLTRQLPNA
jgi:succinylglutamate desuccinylase